MTRLFSILTTEADAGGGFLQFLPLILLIVCGVILLVAFIVGFKKGAKRVSWAGIVWLLAAVAFCVVHGLLGQGLAVSLEGTLAGLAGGFGLEGEALTALQDGLMAFVPAFIIALGCILIVMLVYGLLSLRFRPKIKRIAKNADAYVLDEDGVEYDEDSVDYDDYETYTTKKMPIRINCETPAFFTRLLGGLISLINALMVIATVLVLGLFLLNATSLKDGALSFLFELDISGIVIVPIIVSFASRYALDVFLIGILIAFICKGRRTGFFEALRGFMKLVALVVVCACFYLPFSPFAAEGGNVLLYGLTSRCVNASMNIFGAGTMAWLAPIVGKIFSGLLLAVFAIVVFVLLNWILNKLALWAVKHPLARTVDGTLAAIIYFVIGIAVCFLVWAIWYLLARYGVFNIQELFTEEATLSNGMFKMLYGIVEPLLVRLDQLLGFIPAEAIV